MTGRPWKSRAGSSAKPARSIGSMAATCAPATYRSCSPTPPPAHVRRRWCTRARSARSFRPNRSSAAACWKMPQARPAIRYREVAAKVRKAEAMLFHLRWLEANSDVAETARVHDLSVRDMAERTREQAEAARIQAVRASELPALREAEARAAAGLQRLTNARETLDREEERAKERVAELDRRLTQFAADIAREQQQTSDAEVALQRLDAEDSELKDEIKSRVEKRSGVDERVSEAETTLASAERLLAELTTV